MFTPVARKLPGASFVFPFLRIVQKDSQYQMYIMMLFNSNREDLSQIAIVLAPYKNDTWQTCVLIESY